MSHADETVATGPQRGAIPVSDPEALARLARWGGDQLVRQMVELFLAQAPERLEAARAGLAAGSADEVQRAAHALKSSSAQVGALRVSALCVEIESRGAGGDLAGVPDLLDALERELSVYRAGASPGGAS
jgi:two-component system, sensor histidine kinase and response regulator